VTFYDDWIAASEQNEYAVNNAPILARGKNTKYIATPNDHKIGMLISEETGFPTQGSHLAKAFIPAGHHTGKQRHGEEAIHVLAGTGFIVVDDRRYNFLPGTTIHVPFMSTHQLFNTGEDEVEYITAGSTALDLYVRLGRLEQLEEKGANEPGFEDRFPAEDGQLDLEGRRIALHLADAPDEEKRREEIRKAEREAAAAGGGESRSDGHGHGHGHGHKRHANQSAHRHGAILILMGGGESPSPERNGFVAKSVAMTNIFEEVPHTSSHLHSHTEAMLYALEGQGFSEVDYAHYDWEAGDAVHVPPKMTRHEHFNPSDVRTRTLRIEFGIRYYYEDLWSGFHKVEHRADAIARP
jgi:uncharacterized cupin superfamily protein